MLWFYLSGLMLIIGAEARRNRARVAMGKAPGEKVPGQRKKIGRRRARA